MPMNHRALASQGLMSIGEAARILGVSPDTLRRRESEGKIQCFRSAGNLRRYRVSDIERLRDERAITLKPKGHPTDRVIGEVKLSVEDEQMCIRIAERCATKYTSRISALDWDDAFSDALLGIARALAAPSIDIAWDMHCWNYAKWEIIRGVTRRSAVPEKAYREGMRYDDLPEDRKDSLSVEGLFAEGFDAPAPDEYSRMLQRIDLEALLKRLSKRERISLVNHKGHKFTLDEIAEELGVAQASVNRYVQHAIQALRDEEAIA